MSGSSAAAWAAPEGDPPGWSPPISGHAGLASGRGDDALMSIGEVLAHLRAEFPDVTISKLRFLEAEGLVEPRRTPAGYRKYARGDVARLRYVLTAQRDQYLPLRVIREHLAAMGPGAGALSAVPDAGASGTATATPDADVRVSREELLARCGLAEPALRALEQHGLVATRNGGGYDADAIEVATAAARLAEYGMEPRHLRAYRVAADREVGLFGQLVAPMTRQQGPAGRAMAQETVRELSTLTQRLHAALVRAGLRETLGR